MIPLLRSTLLLLLAPLMFSCSSNGAAWTPYLFDGTDFRVAPDGQTKSVWLRYGYFPYLGQEAPLDTATTKLPAGTGAVAGICYLQTSGGKLVTQSRITPLPDEQITMKLSGEGAFVTRTDDSGYFSDALYPGEYEFYCRGVKVTGRVKQGETTLLPIRGGKRMAD